MGRLQVLAGEGREILVLPARAAAALREDEGVRAMEIWSGGGGRFGKEINWIARVSFVQLTCGPRLKYEAHRDSLGARAPCAGREKGAHICRLKFSRYITLCRPTV